MRVLVAIFSDTDAWTMPPRFVDVLRRRFPEVEFLHAGDVPTMLRLIGDVDVAFTSRLTPEAFAIAKRLKWVHSSAAGVGRMLFPALRTSSVVMTNSRGMNAGSVAEHAFAMMLAVTRRVPDAVRAQDRRLWHQEELSGLPLLRGRTLGLIGLGAIGTELARLGSAFGMQIIGVRRRATEPPPPGVAQVLPLGALATLLVASDYVVVAAPLTAETRGMIGRDELAQMKPTAWLINVARGKLVREADLIEALQQRRIAGAALDVFEHEPLDSASPLWSMPNVFVTPHIAGFRSDYWDAAVDLFGDNLQRFLAGQPLRNVVDKQAGY